MDEDTCNLVLREARIEILFDGLHSFGILVATSMQKYCEDNLLIVSHAL